MKFKLILLTAIFVFVPFILRAQDEAVNGEVSGFSFVLPAKDGGKQCIVRGDTANFLPEGEIEISNVKTQIFRKGSSDIFITSPKAKFNKATREVKTNEEVQISMKEMIIEGKGLYWDPSSNKAEIRKKVKVTILSKPSDIDF